MSISNNSAIIEIRDMHLQFEGRSLFQAFNFCVGAGARIRITGPSGSGKSTLFKSILGFRIPDSGEIRVCDTVISRASIYETRSHIAYVPQELDPGSGTIREVFETPFRYRINHHLKDNLKHIPRLMNRFLLDNLDPDKSMTDLSGGEKQRIAVISAILLNRKIFLLDEVTSALDAEAKSAVTSYFEEEQDLTILAISHDPELAGFNDPVLDLGIGKKGA